MLEQVTRQTVIKTFHSPSHGRPIAYTPLDLVTLIPATAVGNLLVKCYINANSLLSREINIQKEVLSHTAEMTHTY